MRTSRSKTSLKFAGDESLRAMALRVWDTWEYLASLEDQIRALVRLAERAAQYGYDAALAEREADGGGGR